MPNITEQITKKEGEFVEKVRGIQSTVNDTNVYLDELQEQLSPYSVPDSTQSGCGTEDDNVECKLDKELNKLSGSLIQINERIRNITDNFQG